jgi:hypothetical protein
LTASITPARLEMSCPKTMWSCFGVRVCIVGYRFKSGVW